MWQGPWGRGHTAVVPLAVAPCRSLCSWSPAPGPVPAGDLFACAGCGSQWAPDQQWTPVQADGTVPAEVRTARQRSLSGARGAAAGTRGS